MFVVDSIRSSEPIPSRPQAGFANFWLAGLCLVLAQFSCSLQAAEVQARANPEQAEIVYLNTATVQELKGGLIGVGQHRAEAIMAYRERVGDFRNDDGINQIACVVCIIFLYASTYCNIYTLLYAIALCLYLL